MEMVAQFHVPSSRYRMEMVAQFHVPSSRYWMEMEVQFQFLSLDSRNKQTNIASDPQRNLGEGRVLLCVHEINLISVENRIR
jgi:hypothetical protein